MTDPFLLADAPWPHQTSLICHPTTPAPRVQSVTIGIERQPEHRLWLRYHMDLPLDDLVLPPPAEPERADNLWQTSCCELFLRRPSEQAYAECNFSPSSQWAAYRFDVVRRGMANLDLAVPDIALDAGDSYCALEAIITLPREWQDGPLDIGLSAVIEMTGAGKSYWALAHPADTPDFHHPGSFTLRLSPP